MAASGIPMEKAELLSVLLEAILYGFSLLMFGGTVWVLWRRRSNRKVFYRMLTVACTLLVLSTAHLVIHIIRVMEGFLLYGHSSEVVNAFFGQVSQWTFWVKNYIYITQSLVGDGVILYRCYAVWQSKLVMILPGLLWCATAVTGYVAVHMESSVIQDEVFAGALGKWIAAFWAMALSTNLVATVLLACRIWYIDRKVKKLRAGRRSELRPVLHVIIDAGLVYSLTLLVALVCFVSGTNGQYVTLDMVTPIISITFYMVIIRVGLASLATQATSVVPLQSTSSRPSTSVDQRSRLGVQITALTESKESNGLRSPMGSLTPNSRRHEIKLDDLTLEV